MGAALLLPLLLACPGVKADNPECFGSCDYVPGPPVPEEALRVPLQPPLSPEGYPIPRGGSYVHGGDLANLPERLSVVLRVTAFDPLRDPVVIGGQPLHTDAITFPWRVFDHNGSMTLLLDGDGAIVLRGVPQSEWAAGLRAQIQGTASPDNLIGSNSNDIFTPGSGLDTVAPARGDDRINFTSGYLVISSSPPNSGNDTLDLRRFSRSDIAVSVEDDDALIFTPDGAIRLQDQFREGAGGNIEQILLDNDDVWSITSAADFSSSSSN
jgi:hypothetical protein